MNDQPSLNLSDDKSHVILTTSGPQAFGAADFEGFVTFCAHVRAQMVPSVTNELTPGDRFEAITHPQFRAEAEPLMGQSIVHLRDPRFGWLHFLFSKEEARALGTALLAQSQAETPDAPSGRAN